MTCGLGDIRARFLGAAVVLLAGLTFACGSTEVPSGPKTRGAPPPVPVEVARAERRSVSIETAALGTVVPIQTVAVRPRVSGPIVEVQFAEGQEVAAGDVLLRIDRRPYEVALAEQEARLARDRTQLGLARTQAGRARALVQRDLVAREQLDEARTNVASIEATIALDEVAIEAARLNLEFTEIASPIHGRTGSLLATLGNLVSPASLEPLVTIVQLRPIYVSFAVPEAELPAIRARQAEGALRVTARAPGGAATDGQLTFIDSAVDAATGTILLKATFLNDDGALWPGQSVDVTLALGEIPDAVVVPAAAVQAGQLGRYLFVVGPNDTVENRPIVLTRIDEREAVVADGLQGGETVVTDGQLRLVPGGRVKIVGSPAPPVSAPVSRDAATADGRPAEAASPEPLGPFIRRPVMTTLVMAAILAFGLLAWRELPVSDLPNVDFPTIQVGASLPGASPETMASAVATTLERQFSTIAGIDTMTSSSGLGSTSITLQFTLDRSIDAAAQDVQAAIARASRQLPPAMPTPPTYQKVNPSDQPFLYIALTSSTLPLYELDRYGQTMIAQRLSTVSGVAQVMVYGAQKYAVRAQVDPRELGRRGIGIDDVARAIAQSNVNLPTGVLYGPDRAVTIGPVVSSCGPRTTVASWSPGGTADRSVWATWAR